MVDLATLPAKLAKIVPMLGSDKSGEVVAAAQAIGRTLESGGRDWHDLSAAIERGWSAPAKVSSSPPPLQPWQQLARECLMRAGGELRPAERDFLVSMVHWPSEPSEKQRRWLQALAAALNVSCAA